MLQMQQEIRECLTEEMSLLIDHIECNNERRDAIVRIMAHIPCIMHIETRIGIKKYLPFY